MFRLTSLLGNTQKLDGGAMFGHVPKALWQQWITPDEENRIELACRALLIQYAEKNILLETGIGAFFEPALRLRYGVKEASHVLLHSLQEIGLTEKDIDFVILSHLHFDHAGGLLSQWEAGQTQKLLFPNAQYIVGKTAWERASHPHIRDRASFIPELNKLLAASDRLIILEKNKCELLPAHFSFRFSDGHTPGLLHTILQSSNEDSAIIFASDLIPGRHWVHLPVSMGYDRSPEQLIDEKKDLLTFAMQANAFLFYTHDPEFAVSRVSQNDKGKIVAVDMMQTLSAFDF